jgi:glycosyltransferase involved in cell wall biosynthesis
MEMARLQRELLNILRGSMIKNILFLNYQLPFSNTAHSICFTNLFYRFLDYYDKDITRSQDINIFLLGLNVQPDENGKANANFEYFKNSYTGKIQYSLIERKFPHVNNKLNIVYAFFEFIRSAWLLRKFVKRSNIHTVFCYSDPAFFLILFCHTLKVNFIFDCKGDRLSELKYNGRSSIFIKLNAVYLNFLIRRTSKILISSSKLKNIFRDKYLRATFILNTNYYDDKIIKYSSKPRSNDMVRFVYSGSTVKYQMIEETLLLFKYYHEKHNNSELLLLIRDDIELVKQKIKELKMNPGSIIISSTLSLEELNEKLNTCDIAIMLREENPLNLYAFPTKFAEYLASGIPVISTKGVYDTWKIIVEQDFGVIIDLNIPLSMEISKVKDFVQKMDYKLKLRCADFSFQKLSWSNNISRIYHEIIEL